MSTPAEYGIVPNSEQSNPTWVRTQRLRNLAEFQAARGEPINAPQGTPIPLYTNGKPTTKAQAQADALANEAQIQSEVSNPTYVAQANATAETNDNLPPPTAATSPETTTAAPTNTESTTAAPTSSEPATTATVNTFASRWWSAFMSYLSFGDTKL